MEIESINIAPAEHLKRLESPWSAFFIWLAGTFNIGLYPIIFMLSGEYTTPQLIFIFIVSSSFFIIVALISIPGFKLGIPTIAYSKTIFTSSMVRTIASIVWIADIGWQAMGLMTLFYIILSVIDRLDIIPSGLDVISSIMIASLLTYSVPFIGHNALALAQKIISLFVVLISMTIIIYGFHSLLFARHVLDVAHNVAHSGFYYTLSGLCVALIAGAISWSPSASDYTRYIKASYSGRSVFFSILFGGAAGNSLLLISGYILYMNGGVSITQGGIVISRNIATNSIIYYFVLLCFGLSLVATNFITSYSSTFQASVAINKEVNKSYLLVLDGIVATALSSIIVINGHSYITSINDFLSLLQLVVVPWAGITAANSAFFIINRRSRILALNCSRYLKTKSLLNSLVFILTFILIACFSKNSFWQGYLLPLTRNFDLAPLIGFSFSLLLTCILLTFLNLWKEGYTKFLGQKLQRICGSF